MLEKCSCLVPDVHYPNLTLRLCFLRLSRIVSPDSVGRIRADLGMDLDLDAQSVSG